ncbi:MAG: Mobile element protein [Variovorax sp.]|nr:Mobile element protein [Variovorax sp.]
MIDLPCSTFYCRSTAAYESLRDARVTELIESIQDDLPVYGYRRAKEDGTQFTRISFLLTNSWMPAPESSRP